MSARSALCIFFFSTLSNLCVYADDFIEPSMVAIPAGTYTMGSEANGKFKVPHSPQHEVEVKAFQLSKYEVTVGEFQKFVDDTNHKTKSECWTRKIGTTDIVMAPGRWNSSQNAPSKFHPVMCVEMNDALAYMHWLSKKTGKKYRLPSEAEWEYAARAGSKKDYFFDGDEQELCQYANIFDKSGELAFERDLGLDWTGVDCDDNVEYTSMVGMYKPNAFGLFDMIGNVGELVEDCEHLSYVGAPRDGSAWVTDCYQPKFLLGIISFDQKIIHRGGNYGSDGTYSRIFIRGHTGKSNPSSLGEGFRIALSGIEDDMNSVSQSTELYLKELSLRRKFRGDSNNNITK